MMTMTSDQHPYKRTPAQAAGSWERRFGCQAAAMARRHAQAFGCASMRDYWLAVADYIEWLRTTDRSKPAP